MFLNDLLNHFKIATVAVTVAKEHQKVAETRLIDSLALIGKPLKVGGTVVIGDTQIKRPYDYLPVEMTTIENVPPETVVVES